MELVYCYVEEKPSVSQYFVDHLERLKEGNSTAWKYHATEDNQIVFNDQIIPVKVVVDWNVTQNARHMKFQLKTLKALKRNSVIL